MQILISLISLEIVSWRHRFQIETHRGPGLVYSGSIESLNWQIS